MSYCEDFAKQFKPGDKVYVLRKADNYESGWNNTWSQKMDAFVGMVHTIEKISNNNVYFADGIYGFPPFVLEKIVTENPFKVGDTIKVWTRSETVNKVVEHVDALFIITESGGRHRHQFCSLVKPAKKEWKLGCETFSWSSDTFKSKYRSIKLSTLKTIYEQATSGFPPSSWVFQGTEITLENKCFYYGKDMTIIGNIKLLKDIIDSYDLCKNNV